MSYDIDTASIKIIKACNQLLSTGLIARTWGNVSARLDNNTFLITPSGKSYTKMRPSDLVEVSINNLEPKGEGVPSSEKGIHGIAYYLRKDVNFIIHTHQQYASCISILDNDYLTDFPTAEYGMNSSQALINALGHTIRKNKDHNGFLMSNHGAFCLGKDDEEAFNVSKDLEVKSRNHFSSLCGDSYIDNQDAMESFYSDFSVASNEYIEILDASEVLFLLKSPYALAISKLDTEIFPYIDDFAQFAGISMKPISFLEQLQSALTSEITSFRVNQEDKSEISLRQCAILRNKGIVCHSSFDDINALSIVVEKQCQAAFLANIIEGTLPIASENARLDRENYVLSYSKLK